METRAHHLLIGSFVLAAIVGLFGFTIWIAKFSPEANFAEYDMVFHESVAGLSRGGEVQFNGIPVGKVESIRIEGDNASAVRVTASILASTPVQKGSVATLEVKGITGVVYIQIRGAKKIGPPIEAESWRENPEIPTQPSLLFELYEGFPDILSEGAVTLKRVNKLLGEENQRYFTSILANVDKATGAVARRSGDLEEGISAFRVSVEKIGRAADAIERLANSGDSAVKDDLKPALAEAKGMLKETREMAAELHGLVKENRGAISGFANGTLPEIARLVNDLEKLSQSLTRLSDKIEQDPRDAIFGTPRPEHKKSDHEKGEEK